MRRRILTLASAASLLLCMAVVAVWVRSYWVSDVWQYTRLEYLFSSEYQPKIAYCYLVRVELDCGGLMVLTGERGGDPLPIIRWQHVTDRAGAHSHIWWGHDDAFDHLSGTSVPLMAVALMFALPPGVRIWIRLRKTMRVTRGVCFTCSYDLTGNTSGVCPECGTAVPTPKNKESPRPA